MTDRYNQFVFGAVVIAGKLLTIGLSDIQTTEDEIHSGGAFTIRIGRSPILTRTKVSGSAG